jgi:hypothetical protein
LQGIIIRHTGVRFMFAKVLMAAAAGALLVEAPKK